MSDSRGLSRPGDRSRKALSRTGPRRSGQPEPRELLTQRNQTVRGDHRLSHLRARLTFGQTNYLGRSVAHPEVQLGSEDATSRLLDLDVIVAGSASIGSRHNGGKRPATGAIGELIAP